MAMRSHVTNAKAMDSSNFWHGKRDVPVQNFKSFSYKTAIPAEEHAAASDKVAVTCIQYKVIESVEAEKRRYLKIEQLHFDKMRKIYNHFQISIELHEVCI